MLGSTLLVLGIFAGCALLLWFWRGRPAMALKSSHIQLLESRTLGGRDRLVLVQVHDCQLLLGVSSEGIQTIERWEMAEPAPAVARPSRLSVIDGQRREGSQSDALG